MLFNQHFLHNSNKSCKRFSLLILYYNNDRYQWHLAKLSPNEYYQFCTTGEYPVKIPTPPAVPAIQKKPEELGRKQGSNPATAGPVEEPGGSTQGTA